jgi:hypothetical protein
LNIGGKIYELNVFLPLFNKLFRFRNNDVATAQLDRPVKAADIDHSDKEL